VNDKVDRWRELNRANWDERTRVHLGPGSDYDLAALRSGTGKLHPIEDAELGCVRGLRVLHLQCHFGVDTLKLAQRGAAVVGLDFSPAAIEAARKLAAEHGLGGSVRFVLADLYDAPTAIPEPASFDLVFVTWDASRWSWSTTGTTPIRRRASRTPPTSSGCTRCPTLSAA
jgi:SAM-dependent methyltransferase